MKPAGAIAPAYHTNPYYQQMNSRSQIQGHTPLSGDVMYKILHPESCCVLSTSHQNCFVHFGVLFVLVEQEQNPTNPPIT
jgi:hypothetical protein